MSRHSSIILTSEYSPNNWLLYFIVYISQLLPEAPSVSPRPCGSQCPARILSWVLSGGLNAKAI